MSDLAAFGMSYLASKGLDIVFSKIGSLVLQRCAERRAVNFLESFLKEIEAAKGKRQSLPQVLDKYLEDETSQEYIFAAYRKVIFSASKDIGPKIIGLITANALLKGKNEFDELVGMAAESLTDNDFLKMHDFFAKYRYEMGTRRDGTLEFTIDRDPSNSFSNEPNLESFNETWLHKLQQLNLAFVYTDQKIVGMMARAGGGVQDGDFKIQKTTFLVLMKPVEILEKYYGEITCEQK